MKRCPGTSRWSMTGDWGGLSLECHVGLPDIQSEGLYLPPLHGSCSPGAPHTEGIGCAFGPSFRMASKAARAGPVWRGRRPVAKHRSRPIACAAALLAWSDEHWRTRAPLGPHVSRETWGAQLSAGSCSRTRDPAIRLDPLNGR